MSIYVPDVGELVTVDVVKSDDPSPVHIVGETVVVGHVRVAGDWIYLRTMGCPVGVGTYCRVSAYSPRDTLPCPSSDSHTPDAIEVAYSECVATFSELSEKLATLAHAIRNR